MQQQKQTTSTRHCHHNKKLSIRMTALLSLVALSSKQRSCQFAKAFTPLVSRQYHNGRSTTTSAATTVRFLKNSSSPSLPKSLVWRYMSTEATTPADLTEEQKTELEVKIKAKGDEIRALKESGADKQTVAPLVTELLALKAELDPSSATKTDSKKKDNKKDNKKDEAKEDGENNEGSESDFITARSENYSKWYNDIIRFADLAETSPVRGCMVIKPWGMSLWENIRDDLDGRIKEHGAENAYFPLLIPKSFLSKEAEHVDGFAKECAVVTHHRLTADPSGEKGLIADPEAELEDPLIIRPTSETMIWNMFKKWIISHR